ncbi:hypothetical protein [Dermatobacter hominis]|uniref:hypothetical protein n=1 Tax=Dermatobacter hominis TaxID=2884263 RepID=UPI001D115BB5|nr:hypothetical protein [Dermatobacter hominis]UDY37043.1 hypothetical protein LH044_05775 [Dermatobacter hominis]
MSTSRNTLARSVHDLGLAAWFGGSLMGAIGVNRSAAKVARSKDTTHVAGAGWSAWTPVNLVAIGAYLGGGTVLTISNKGRVTAQKGVGTTSIVKTGLTAVALAATGYSRLIGQKVIDAERTPAEDGTTPDEDTPPEIAAAQRQLAILQWVIPATTGGLVVLSSLMGEQQRPSQVAGGVVHRLTDRVTSASPFGTNGSSDPLHRIAEHLPQSLLPTS